jgi:hypothetical protein
MTTLPRWLVPPLPERSWDEIPALSPLVLAADGRPAEHSTLVRVCADDAALRVRFDCVDHDAWGTLRRRDDPIYQEEAVEVFLAPGEEDPVRYFEIEVSPLGVLFDALIHNPTSQRADMTADVSWDCPGLKWKVGMADEREDWWAVLTIPWSGLVADPAADPNEIPRIWRANFYRIERPRDAAPELSCWSPTFTDPADFHKPARFGVLELGNTR